MSADFKVGIISTIYSTWLHNSLAIALLGAIIFSALLMLLKPRRKFVFFFFGFALLLLEFEYEKHFGKSLEQQTINSVILQGKHLQARDLISDFFGKLVPFLMWLGGWGMIFVGMIP